MKFTVLIAVASYIASASAFTIKFKNNCHFTVWPAVGKAPNGHPDKSVAFGTTLHPGGTASFKVNDHQLGIRAWGRTGCNSSGASCTTGNCKGGLVCTDGGINSGVLVSEFGYANFGPKFGGKRISWDLSRVDLAININTKLTASDGAPSATCLKGNCPDDQAYSYPTDYAADRNSKLGTTFTHTFCP